MAVLKNKISDSCLSAAALPLGISLAAATQKSPFLASALVPAMLIAVALFPGFRGRESLGLFLVVAVSGVPMNLLYTQAAVRTWCGDANSLLMKALWGVMIYVVLISFEEILLGLVGRLLWCRQYRPKL